MSHHSKQTILIVEDEQTLSEAYEMILSAEGYNVDTVSDGSKAMQYIDQKQPDLILLDLRMPVMSGLEFLEAANMPTRMPDVPVIVFSNFDVQKDIDEAYRLGASRYILKAWAAPKELARIVKETLSEQ